jgi:hypothetical protein
MERERRRVEGDKEREGAENRGRVRRSKTEEEREGRGGKRQGGRECEMLISEISRVAQIIRETIFVQRLLISTSC